MINSLLFYLLGTILRAAILYLFYKTVIGVAKTRMAAVIQKRLAIAAIILLFVPVHCFTIPLSSDFAPPYSVGAVTPALEMTPPEQINPAPEMVKPNLPPSAPITIEPTFSISWQTILLGLLLCVGMVKCSVLLHHYFRLRRELKYMKEIDDKRIRKLCLEAFRLSEIPAQQVTCRNAGTFFSSPAACRCGGIQLLMPAKAIACYNNREIRMLLLHECSHIKRHDLLSAHLFSGLAALVWFNPFLHLLIREVERAAELTADADAIRWSGTEEGNVGCYANLMVELAAAPVADSVIRGMSFGYVADLKTRILALGTTRRTPRILVCILFVALCAFAVILPTIAAKEVNSQEQEKMSEDSAAFNSAESVVSSTIAPNSESIVENSTIAEERVQSVESETPSTVEKAVISETAPMLPSDINSATSATSTISSSPAVTATVNATSIAQEEIPDNEPAISSVEQPEMTEQSAPTEAVAIVQDPVEAKEPEKNIDPIPPAPAPVVTEGATGDPVIAVKETPVEETSIQQPWAEQPEMTEQSVISQAQPAATASTTPSPQPLPPSETKVFFNGSGNPVENTLVENPEGTLFTFQDVSVGDVIEAPFSMIGKTVELGGEGMTISGTAVQSVCEPTIVLSPVGNVMHFTGEIADIGMKVLGKGIAVSGKVLAVPTKLFE